MIVIENHILQKFLELCGIGFGQNIVKAFKIFGIFMIFYPFFLRTLKMRIFGWES